MRDHVITILFLVLALFLYARGAAVPATGLLVLGAISEGIFWWRLVRRRKRVQGD